MKTSEILQVFQYDSLGGPIDAVPLQHIIQFCERVRDRIEDNQADLLLAEIKQIIASTK